MKRKWLLIVLALILMIGIGGRVYMDKKEEGKTEEIIEVERMSVIALKNRYENIKSIEFEKSGYDVMTGAYVMFVKMTNHKNESVNFSYTFWKEKNEVGSAVLNSKEVQVKGITTNKVQVIYSNNEEGEV